MISNLIQGQLYVEGNQSEHQKKAALPAAPSMHLYAKSASEIHNIDLLAGPQWRLSRIFLLGNAEALNQNSKPLSLFLWD